MNTNAWFDNPTYQDGLQFKHKLGPLFSVGESQCELYGYATLCAVGVVLTLISEEAKRFPGLTMLKTATKANIKQLTRINERRYGQAF